MGPWIFAMHGIPDKVITDNGPQFASYAFSKFAYQWKFLWVSSSPTHAQSNDMAERAVQTARNIITKCTEDGSNIHLASLNLRNTPRVGITGSPAQRLFGRRTRTRLPTTTALLKPKTELPEKVQEHLTKYQARANKYYDVGSKALPPLMPGDMARVCHGKMWQPAKLIAIPQRAQPREYNVLMPSGRVWRRNRRDLMATKETDIFHREHDTEPVNTSQLDQPITPIQAQMPQHTTPQDIRAHIM